MKHKDRPVQYGAYKHVPSEQDMQAYMEWAHKDAEECVKRIGAKEYDIQYITKKRVDFDDFFALIGSDPIIFRGVATIGWKMTVFEAEKNDMIDRLTEGIEPVPK
jgi:hypothetical protein